MSNKPHLTNSPRSSAESAHSSARTASLRPTPSPQGAYRQAADLAEACAFAAARQAYETLTVLLNDSSLRERLGRAGRERFEKRDAWLVIIEKHYLSLLCRRSKP